MLLSHLEKLLCLVLFGREIIIGHDCKKGKESGEGCTIVVGVVIIYYNLRYNCHFFSIFF